MVLLPGVPVHMDRRIGIAARYQSWTPRIIAAVADGSTLPRHVPCVPGAQAFIFGLPVWYLVWYICTVQGSQARYRLMAADNGWDGLRRGPRTGSKKCTMQFQIDPKLAQMAPNGKMT